MLDLTFEPPKPKLIEGANGPWELVIGMEIHAQVASKAKLFSGASTAFGAEPNSNVAFVDAAMPGMLPVVNEFCIEQAVRTGLGLKAQDQPDLGLRPQELLLPRPAAGLPDSASSTTRWSAKAKCWSKSAPGVARRVRIERIHVEQDAGKSIHDMDPAMSFVDLNRTGVALMEIVSRPDLRGPEEAAAYVVKLRQILRYLGTCDGNMQNGNLRADVNVSVCKPGQYEKYQADPGLRPSRHPLRDQEHELDAVHPGRHRLRGAPPDRACSRTAAGSTRKPGSTTPTGRDPVDALEGRGA